MIRLLALLALLACNTEQSRRAKNDQRGRMRQTMPDCS